jgi:hypothetical protein
MYVVFMFFFFKLVVGVVIWICKEQSTALVNLRKNDLTRLFSSSTYISSDILRYNCIYMYL